MPYLLEGWNASLCFGMFFSLLGAQPESLIQLFEAALPQIASSLLYFFCNRQKQI
jgi:hypothetical protein